MGSSLVVTLIGMAVVFVAMSLFYLSMHLLTALTREKKQRGPDQDTDQEQLAKSTADVKNNLRAAAIAVALARAEQESVLETGSPYDYAPISPWGDFYRQRQLGGTRGRIA